jgi:hypothetical protein
VAPSENSIAVIIMMMMIIIIIIITTLVSEIVEKSLAPCVSLPCAAAAQRGPRPPQSRGF